TAARAGDLRREIAGGALVVGARPGSPAQRAGLRADDIIIEADGVAIETMAALVSYIQLRRPGSALKLVVWRDGKRLALTATVGRMPAAIALMQQIEALTSEKKYAQAIPLAQRLAAATKADPGPRSGEPAAALARPPSLPETADQPTGAEPVYRGAVPRREQAWGADHRDMVKPLSELADFYSRQERYVDAERTHRRILAIQEANGAPT